VTDHAEGTEVAIEDEDHEWRLARARRYFDEDLQGQRKWYGRKAARLKNCHIYTSFVIIGAGAATSVLQIWSGAGTFWIGFATALLGALVVVTKGAQDLYKYQETWLSYRKASESMKRELRLFVNARGPYRSAASNEEAYGRFVERVEQVIAEEQNIFFDRQSEEKGR